MNKEEFFKRLNEGWRLVNGMSAVRIEQHVTEQKNGDKIIEYWVTTPFVDLMIIGDELSEYKDDDNVVYLKKNGIKIARIEIKHYVLYGMVG